MLMGLGKGLAKSTAGDVLAVWGTSWLENANAWQQNQEGGGVDHGF